MQQVNHCDCNKINNKALFSLRIFYPGNARAHLGISTPMVKVPVLLAHVKCIVWNLTQLLLTRLSVAEIPSFFFFSLAARIDSFFSFSTW